ncbi:MAG TPA: alpha/beta hydrolase [Myxococcota bacterium]|nr:alpha/beta hydrolase [Myxococcota bacterium]
MPAVITSELTMAARAARRRRRAWWTAAVLLALGGVYVASVLALQRLFTFPRYAVRAAPDAGAGVAGLERWWLDTDEGRVEAWFLPGRGAAPGAPAPIAVFTHGNGELIDYWAEPLAPYRAMGVSVLLPEYRGYGRSAGSPSEAAITADLVAFLDRAVARADVDPARVVLHGRSIGGGAACALAARRRPAALILQSTFTSLADVMRRFFVPRALVLDPFDSLAVVRSLDVPTLVVHGRHDALIPVAHAEALARAAPRARLVLYDGGHNDTPPDWAPLWGEIHAFLAEAGILPAATRGGG